MQAAHGDAVRWSQSEHLLAGIFDAISLGNWQYASRNSKRQVPKPEALRRPGEADPTVRRGGQRSYTRAQLDRILARMRPKRG